MKLFIFLIKSTLDSENGEDLAQGSHALSETVTGATIAHSIIAYKTHIFTK